MHTHGLLRLFQNKQKCPKTDGSLAWGGTGSIDCKLGEGSSVSLRGLYSNFRNWRNKWVFTTNDGEAPQYSQDWRAPHGHLQFESRRKAPLWFEHNCLKCVRCAVAIIRG
jgi:hypothetical protein